jgi:hypothetical protein
MGRCGPSTSLTDSLLFIDISMDSTVVMPVIEFSCSANGRFRFLCAGMIARKLSVICYLILLSFAIDMMLSRERGWSSFVLLVSCRLL